MNARNVARSTSSSTPAAAATKAGTLLERGQCADTACAALLEQTPTGRRRKYCDATCRANAARRRAWSAHDAAMAAHRADCRQAQADHDARLRAWQLLPFIAEPAWMDPARAAGWSPPYTYRRTKTEPAPTYTAPRPPSPPSCSRPRDYDRGSW